MMPGLALLLLVQAAEANPLASADAGELQCYGPNEESHTCRALAAYRRIDASSYDNIATVPVGSYLLETVTPVRIQNGAVCGHIRAEDVTAGSLSTDGHLLPATEAKPVLDQFVAAMAGMIGKEICTTYVPTETGLIAKVSIDGVYQEDTDQPVKWIKPGDGYTVAP